MAQGLNTWGSDFSKLIHVDETGEKLLHGIDAHGESVEHLRWMLKNEGPEDVTNIVLQGSHDGKEWVGLSIYPTPVKKGETVTGFHKNVFLPYVQLTCSSTNADVRVGIIALTVS